MKTIGHRILQICQQYVDVVYLQIIRDANNWSLYFTDQTNNSPLYSQIITDANDRSL